MNKQTDPFQSVYILYTCSCKEDMLSWVLSSMHIQRQCILVLAGIPLPCTPDRALEQYIFPDMVKCRLLYWSGPCKPDSQCRLSKAHIQLRETPGGRDFGMGRGWGWGDQFTSNLGPRWTGSYHIKEGFQVSKGKWKRGKGRQKAKSKGIAP